MKQLNQEIRAHLQGEVTTLCRCWIVTRNDGTKIGFTDHDCDLEIDDVICEREASVEISQVEERIGLNVNATEVSGALQSDFLSSEDIDAGLYDNAEVSVFVVNWQTSSEYFQDHAYHVGNITQEDGVYHMELRGQLSKLDQTQGRHFVTRCQADLGDNQCKVSLDQNGFIGSGTIVSVQSPLIIEVTGLNDFDANWFKGGRLTWTDDNNQDGNVQIAEHTQSNGAVTLQLWEAQPILPEAGDRFSIQVGCDKSLDTCKAKFANIHNFRGFPHMPGSQVILGNASSFDVFDGGPLVP